CLCDFFFQADDGIRDFHVTRVQTCALPIFPPGNTWETSFLPAGEAGTNEGYLEISSIPSLNLGKRLNYLILYPHGCVEQITSSRSEDRWVGKAYRFRSSQNSSIKIYLEL